MKKNLQKEFSAFIVTSLLFSAIANAQNVNIPDAVFKSKLVNNPAINTNGDGEVQVSEAAAFSGVINVSTTWPLPNISDLTGIEAFTALTGLDCSENVLTSLDVSSNTALTTLNCRINQLTSLDVSVNTALTLLACQNNSLTSLNISTNTALTTLFCGNNALTSLDVSANTALTMLSCGHNALTSLDVSANTALTGLACNYNQLTSLDVSVNTALSGLTCGNNSITSLDVSANTALTSLDCRYNSLTSLDVSAHAALVYLYCLNNALTSLDVSANTALEYFHCSSNQLASLNVQNGNNVNFTALNATNNPNLICIQVDNVAIANSYTGVTFIKDTVASYSTNCGVTSVPDINNLSTMQIFPNPATNHFNIALGSSNQKVEVSITDITGKIVYATTESDPDSYREQKVEVNTQDFAAGIYLVQTQTADFIAKKKLVIEN
jgi:Leucine-rich repeat (LRR) protein